jgi:hypothetical protein
MLVAQGVAELRRGGSILKISDEELISLTIGFLTRIPSEYNEIKWIHFEIPGLNNIEVG